ncbi:uncharacterized protein [Typha angustifolia]|uniref:uncharacterized protein n=1 Tax=Typha angustifolia TaxID=59011 RepID=UPI003C2F751E
MPPPLLPQHSRINLNGLKSQIARKLGPERAKQYFRYLNQLLAQKLSKQEFSKYCLFVLGRENIPLHNRLIHSILKNALLAKSPPQPLHEKPIWENSRAAGKKTSEKDDGSNQSPAPSMLLNGWSNGGILLRSPRKVRSGMQDRRIKDSTISLGSNGLAGSKVHQAIVLENQTVTENGILGRSDLKRPVLHHRDKPFEQPAKRPRLDNILLNDQAFVHNNRLDKVSVTDDEKEVEQSNKTYFNRGYLQALLGIPFCPASVGGARRSWPLLNKSSVNNSDSGELCDTEVLKSRMERIAKGHGLGEVTLDCANLLNKALDTYLKCLIRSCVDLIGARSGHQSAENPVDKQQCQVNRHNRIWPGNQMYVQSNSRSSNGKNKLEGPHLMSLQDFRIAMEFNPQQLGEDWPSLLEKICLHSCEE